MEINLFNLAGVPSIIYGLMGLSLLVYGLSMGQTILVAGLTLSALILPMIILTTREALRMVPVTIREAAYSIGYDRWQTLWQFVLPQASAGILPGIIASLSRAMGEVAPLISLGVFSYVAFLPSAPLQTHFPWLNFSWLQEPFNTLPLQMFNWLFHPQAGFHQDAAAAGLVLLMMTLFINVLMIWIRIRLRQRYPVV
jgi:phosphate transport system permease protein